ncbi:protein translocase subunit yidC [Nitrosospira sp. Nsp5]|uniref:Membrane protein insertase YidC n=1 Tax=Nitrosospira multiformis TaxID=1231 RepID=A0ABY0T6S1_9PROT|nr:MULTISPECIES: membrane protein insertase YidC [Nitrosospira]PTR07193.1 protein translocase subunit yidC [Nitrosospira sp. Nsp5]SDQ35552.1 protein translocase subunit yidC [Nitrosospira multiformis]
MDTQKFVLFLIFSTSMLFLWDAWQKEQNPPPPAAVTAQGPGGESSVRRQEDTPVPGEKLVSTQPGKSEPSAESADSVKISGKLESGEKIVVKTDLVVAEINTAGGDLRQLELLDHPDKEDKNKPFALLQSQYDHVYVAQSGLIGEGLPSHKTRYTTESHAYELAGGQDKIEVRLVAPEADGVRVTKIYTFHRGSYLIDVSFEVTNQGTAAIQPFSYFQMLRDSKPPVGSVFMIPTYTGAALYTEEEKFKKIEFSALDKGNASYPKNADNGWIAMLQHYFLTAWLPTDKSQREYYAKRLGENEYTAGVIVPVGQIEPGNTATVTVPLYAGPEEQSKLAAVAPGLDLTVDYGWLTVIGAPLFWLLSFYHSWTGNWGVAIILLTMSVKLAFFPLSAAGYRSMAKLRVVTPKLQRLREQHGADRQRMHQAMMDFYKTEKINPMGGCLPIVVQIPVFISLYWVLLASVELRYAPFALWIEDMSSPDPYYVLPVIMGISMFVQSKLSPPATDPIQAKVMQIMPLAFSVFFFFFPAGLVLYSLVNNILSITQQWQITRMIERAAAKSSNTPALKKK